MRKEPGKPTLVNKILNELRKNPKGLWIRKLSRNLNEPVATVYKYITRDDYCGRFITVKAKPKELGGNMMIKLKRGKK